MIFYSLSHHKLFKRSLCFILSFMLIVLLFPKGQLINASGVTVTGTVAVSDSLNVRSEPSTNGSVLGSLSGGSTVTILETVNDSSGALDSSGNIHKWYKIEFNSSFGYVRSDYITNITETEVPGVVPAVGVYGVISALNTNVNLRSGAGTSYNKIGELKDCQLVTVIDSTTVSGATWYKIQTADGTQGYVNSSYIIVSAVSTSTDTADSEFEAYLQANFPESYHESLRTLHIIYPEWTFIPYSAGDWNEAVTAESKLGVSLVSSTALSSWKSTQSGAYNWETSEWVGLDSDKWVAASQEIVEYFLDPRNFFGPDTIFQFLYQGFDEEIQTKEGLQSIISNSFLSDTSVDTDNDDTNGITTYADTIYLAGQTYGVNPYVLAAMIIQEIGREGTSGSISGTVEGYEGYYNFYNIGAYASGNMTATQRGLWYAKGGNNGATTYQRPWDTRYKSILGGAEFYSEGYISSGQTSLYTKRFNVAPTNSNDKYTHQYMTNAGGAASEGYILSDAYSEEMRSIQLPFYIPVYENMPSEREVMPTGDGSPNNKLSSLSVEGYELTPTFQYTVNEYSLIVENNISSAVIAASAYDSTATIAVNGQSLSDGKATIPLAVGENTVNVNVTAENGNVNTYTITIARQAGDVSVSVSSSVYTISENNIVTKIPLGTTVSEILANLTITGNAYASITTSTDAAKGNESIVATGDKITIYNADGSSFSALYILIYGDVTGDGKINNSDLIKIRNHILGTSQLQDIFVSAADVTKDSSVSNSDLIKVRNHILGTSQIAQ